jgi:hypothetical protein
MTQAPPLLQTLRWRRWLETLAGRLSVSAPILLVLFPGQRAAAATLPDQRADFLYHMYEGGGETVQGPALLVRKNFAEKASVSAGYSIDSISGASIDVVTNASPYHEEQRQLQLGGDYLYRDTLVSASYIGSLEHDYRARSVGLSVAQDMFDNRTTIALSYSRGHDTVGEVHTDLHAVADHNTYGVSLTQVINPTLIGSLGYEAIADDGYLQNPYRSARVLGASVAQSYPGTRTGQAASLKLVKSWSPTFSSRFEARYYHDTWQVNAINAGFTVSTYVYRGILLEDSYRFYTQKAASFYSDDFERPETYMSRDKVLSSFYSHSLGTKLSVPLYHRENAAIKSLTVNYAVNYVMFHYRDFTDIRNGQLYGFNATVAQVFLTAQY